MAPFATPLQLTVKIKIPMVLWGENSANEYGGDDLSTIGSNMNNFLMPDWRWK